MATYIYTITTVIHSQYFFLYDKVSQLEAGLSDTIISKTPFMNFVFDSAKVIQPSSDPLIEPATNFGSPIFRTHPHGYNFFIKFYPHGIGLTESKCALIVTTLFLGKYDFLLQWPFSKLIHNGIRGQLDPLNTGTQTIWPDQDPADRKPTIPTKTGSSTTIINDVTPHSKMFRETEGFLIDGASFIAIKFSEPPVLKPRNQTSSTFFFHRAPQSFSLAFERDELSRNT